MFEKISKIRNSVLIKKRLNSLILIIAVLIVILGVVSIRGVTSINKKIKEINVVYLDNIVELSKLVENLYALLIENNIHNEGELTEVSANNAVNLDLISNLLSDFEQSLSNKEQINLYNKFKLEFFNYISIQKEISALKLINKYKLIREIRTTKELKSFKKLQSLVNDMVNYNSIGIVENSKNIKQLEKQVLTKLYIYSIIILLLSIGIIFFLLKDINPALKTLKNNLIILGKGEIPNKKIPESNNEIGLMAKLTNELISNISKINKFAIDITQGNYETNISILQSDLLGNALVNLRNNLKHAKKEDEKRKLEEERRNWTNKGHAIFGEILRQRSGSTLELTDNIIKNLVYYLNANQGGLFTITDEDKKSKSKLKLASAFAYDRKKFLEKEIEIGDGLIGTVALEKHTIYLNEIPKDYIEIESGLGDSNPNSILIVPLKFEEDILGVVEIASFKKFSKYEITFVEEVAQSIASSLLSARISEQTEHLLEESRRQSETLALQEVKARENIEKMEATQELYKKREADLSGILTAVDNTLMKGEYETNGTLISVNDRHLKTFGYQLSEIKGKNIEMFIPKNELDDFRVMWKNVTKGNAKQIEVKRKTKTGRIIWLINQYTPVKNVDGKISKVLYLAHDITKHKQNEEKSIEKANTLQLKVEDLIENTNNIQNEQNKTKSINSEITKILNVIEESTLIIEFDTEEKITHINNTFLEYFENNLDEMIGNKLDDFVEIERKQEDKEKIWNEIIKGNSLKLNEKYNFKNKKNIWLEQTYINLFDKNNKPYKVVLIAKNITKQKNIEIQNEILEKQSETLSELLKERENHLKNEIEEIKKEKFPENNEYKTITKQLENYKKEIDEKNIEIEKIKQKINENEKEKNINFENEKDQIYHNWIKKIIQIK